MVRRKPPLRFGDLAVAKGFCTAKDVAKALKLQAAQDKRGERHRLLGILMIQEGILSTAQLIELLKGLQPATSSKPV
jgi:hypothetical protein